MNFSQGEHRFQRCSAVRLQALHQEVFHLGLKALLSMLLHLLVSCLLGLDFEKSCVKFHLLNLSDLLVFEHFLQKLLSVVQNSKLGLDSL